MRLSLLACVLCLGAGCSGSTVVLDAGPEPDGALPAGRLVLESPASLALVFGEESPIGVQYTESGVPVAGVSIRFGLEGRANDSTLTELVVTTDAEGRASTRLRAASVASVFRVRVDTDRAAQIGVDVSVSGLGFGGLVVEAPYTGRREGAARRLVEIGPDLDCGSLRPGDGRTMFFSAPEETEVVFPSLPVGPRYAVAARVEGASGTVLARGCVDGVELVRDASTRVSIDVTDRALTLGGNYTSEVALASEPVAGVVRNVFLATNETIIAAAGSPAGLCLDALERRLDTSGRDWLVSQRAALELSLGDTLTSAGAGPDHALDRLGARLQERLQRITLGGPLAVTDLGATFDLQTIALAATSDPDGTGLSFPASNAGASALELTASVRPDEDVIDVSAWAFSLSLSALSLAMLEAEARVRGVVGPVGLLDDGAGCDVLATWVAARPALGCDGMCARAACDAALESLWRTLETYLIALDTLFAVVRTSGALSARDADGDLTPERLETPLPWMGSWSSGLDEGLAVEVEVSASRSGG